MTTRRQPSLRCPRPLRSRPRNKKLSRHLRNRLHPNQVHRRHYHRRRNPLRQKIFRHHRSFLRRLSLRCPRPLRSRPRNKKLSRLRRRSLHLLTMASVRNAIVTRRQTPNSRRMEAGVPSPLTGALPRRRQASAAPVITDKQTFSIMRQSM